MAAAGHRTDEYALVQEALAHADAIAEDRSPRERARGVHRDDRDTVTARPVRADERAHQCRLPAAGRAGHADHRCFPGVAVRRAHQLGRSVLIVLEHRERAGDGVRVAGAGSLQQLQRSGRHGVDRTAPVRPKRPAAIRSTVSRSINDGSRRSRTLASGGQ